MGDINIKWTSDVRDLEKDNEKLRKQLTRTEEKLVRMGDRAKRGNQEARRGADEWSRSIVKLGASYLGLSKVMGTVRDIGRQMKEDAETAAQKQRAAAFQLGSLKELAATAPDAQKRYNELVAKTMQFQKTAGIPLGEAGVNVFDIVSAGSEANLDFYARLAGSRMMRQPGEVAKQAAALKTAMPGRFQADEQLLSMVLGMSGKTRTTVPELMEAGARGAGIAGKIGLAPEEHMAAVTLISKILGPEMAGTYVGQMERTMYERGIKGGSLREIIQKTPELAIERQMDKAKGGKLKAELDRMMQTVEAGGEVDPEILKKYMGRSQGMFALQMIQVQEKMYEEIKAAGLEGQQRNIVRAGMALRHPLVDAAIQREKAEVGKEQVMTDFGARENLKGAMKDALDARDYERGNRGFGLWMSRQVRGWRRGETPFADFSAGQLNLGDIREVARTNPELAAEAILAQQREGVDTRADISPGTARLLSKVTQAGGRMPSEGLALRAVLAIEEMRDYLKANPAVAAQLQVNVGGE